jgi:hypothetical protein
VVFAGNREFPVSKSPTEINIIPGALPSIAAYVEGGRLFVDADLYYAGGKRPLRLKHNKLMNRPSQWDNNLDESAIEIVDERGKPRFQLIYHDLHTVFLRGIFQAEGDRAVVVEEHNWRFFMGSTGSDMETAPLFRYPSRLYKGQELGGPSLALSVPPSPPHVEVGFALGAESVFNGSTACGVPPFVCYSENEINGRTFEFDRTQWRRIIYRFRNLGDTHLTHPHIHVESSHTGVKIFYGGQRDVDRQVRYVMEGEIADIPSYSLSQSFGAYPIDVIVEPRVEKFDLYFKIFGDSMTAHQVVTHFAVKH